MPVSGVGHNLTFDYNYIHPNFQKSRTTKKCGVIGDVIFYLSDSNKEKQYVSNWLGLCFCQMQAFVLCCF